MSQPAASLVTDAQGLYDAHWRVNICDRTPRAVARSSPEGRHARCRDVWNAGSLSINSSSLRQTAAHALIVHPMRVDGKRWLAKMELPQITMEMPIAWGGDYGGKLAHRWNRCHADVAGREGNQ